LRDSNKNEGVVMTVIVDYTKKKMENYNINEFKIKFKGIFYG